ncbi:hypothetical protein Q5752_001293 [Cryptotrichosporon argae]
MSYLPPASGGFLPYWLLITAGASLYNVVQNYVTLWQTKEVYSGAAEQVTPLAARLFSAYTMMSAGIRIAAAYDIKSRALYDLSALAFSVAAFHFTTEWLVFGTVRPNRASSFPLLIGAGSLVWVLTQRSFYLGL